MDFFKTAVFGLPRCREFIDFLGNDNCTNFNFLSNERPKQKMK